MQAFTGPTTGPDKTSPNVTFSPVAAVKADAQGRFSLALTNPNGYTVTITAVVTGPAGTKAKLATWATSKQTVKPKAKGKPAEKQAA